MKMTAVLNVTPCRLVKIHQHFARYYHPHFSFRIFGRCRSPRVRMLECLYRNCRSQDVPNAWRLTGGSHADENMYKSTSVMFLLVMNEACMLEVQQFVCYEDTSIFMLPSITRPFVKPEI
jgi:hypothetical protein